MKRLFLLAITFLILVTAGYAVDLSLTLYGNVLSASDSSYKDVYGGGTFYPELRVESQPFIYKNKISLWGGLGYLSASGTIPGFDEQANASQVYVAAGCGYTHKLAFLLPRLSANAKLGLVYFNYREEAMDTEVSDSSIGITATFGVTYDIDKKFFAALDIGFLTGSGTIAATDELSEDISVKLGGFKFGLGVGYRFQ